MRRGVVAAQVALSIRLLMTTAGVYGVGSFSVAIRAREIAIRAAVGARRAQIVRMVVNDSMRSVAWGLLTGSAAAVIVSRIIQAEYHGIRDLDVTTLTGAAGLFVAAISVASGLPALRASRFDPMAILRAE